MIKLSLFFNSSLPVHLEFRNPKIFPRNPLASLAQSSSSLRNPPLKSFLFHFIPGLAWPPAPRGSPRCLTAVVDVEGAKELGTSILKNPQKYLKNSKDPLSLLKPTPHSSLLTTSLPTFDTASSQVAPLPSHSSCSSEFLP